MLFNKVTGEEQVDNVLGVFERHIQQLDAAIAQLDSEVTYHQKQVLFHHTEAIRKNEVIGGAITVKHNLKKILGKA